MSDEPTTEGPDDRVGGAVDPDEERERDDEHLAGVADGCGCTEVWEHLSERREE